ncbi:MAG: hypothetical protein JSU92_04105 [Deltaproteobacteria bacterium]|nr:MAG: hypothetical protein JSU92_04105 [Deltaproteobacteria bacterium]
MANGKGNGRKDGNGEGNGRDWAGTAVDVVLTGMKFVAIGGCMGIGGYLVDRILPNPNQPKALHD